MSRESVLAILRELQPTLRREHGVSSLSLFGSTGRNEATERSDVDLLVEFDRPIGLFRLFQLQDELQNLLGTPVDIGTRNSLRPRIKANVEADEVHVF
jgi:predicted nucleotidyltransferase